MSTPDRPVFGILPPIVNQPQSPTPKDRVDTKAFRERALNPSTWEFNSRLHIGIQLPLGLPETPPPVLTLITPVTIFPGNALSTDSVMVTPPRQGSGGLEPKERVDVAAFRNRALSHPRR